MWNKYPLSLSFALSLSVFHTCTIKDYRKLKHCFRSGGTSSFSMAPSLWSNTMIDADVSVHQNSNTWNQKVMNTFRIHIKYKNILEFFIHWNEVFIIKQLMTDMKMAGFLCCYIIPLKKTLGKVDICPYHEFC